MVCCFAADVGSYHSCFQMLNDCYHHLRHRDCCLVVLAAVLVWLLLLLLHLSHKLQHCKPPSSVSEPSDFTARKAIISSVDGEVKTSQHCQIMGKSASWQVYVFCSFYSLVLLLWAVMLIPEQRRRKLWFCGGGLLYSCFLLIVHARSLG